MTTQVEDSLATAQRLVSVDCKSTDPTRAVDILRKRRPKRWLHCSLHPCKCI